MSWNPIEMVRDRLAINCTKKQYLSALDIARRRGATGVSIPSPADAKTPKFVIMAIEELVKESLGRITVARFRGSPMLCYESEVAPKISRDLQQQLDQVSFFAKPDDPITGIDPYGVGVPETKEENS